MNFYKTRYETWRVFCLLASIIFLYKLSTQINCTPAVWPEAEFSVIRACIKFKQTFDFDFLIMSKDNM